MKRVLLCGAAALLPASQAWASEVALADGRAGLPSSADEAAEAGEAAEAPAAVARDNPEIVITGARSILPATALPLTYDVLAGEALGEQVAVSGSVVDAVSARLPAFSPTREKLSGSGETLRGRSPLYAINGVPQSTPIRDGARDGYTIDPFFIDRVEVIYGSNALQGIGATGGAVNQVTVGAPAADGFAVRTLAQGSVQGGLGSDSGGKAAGLAAWRGGAFDATAGAAFERRGAFVDGRGDRIGVDGTQGEIQDSDSWSAFGRLGYQLGATARLELVANRFELEGNGNYVVVPGFPTTSRLGQTPGEPTSNRAELLSLSFAESDLAGGALSAQAFFSRTRDIFGGGTFGTFQDVSIAPAGTLFDQSVNRSRKVGGKLSYERAVPGADDLVVSAGFDALFDRTAQGLLLTGRTWVPQSDFRSLAPFAQANLKLLDGRLRLAAGGRYESVRLDVPDFTTLASYGSRSVAGGSPKFARALVNGGLVAEPVDGLRAYASYAEGYTIADVGRILRGINSDGVDVDDFLDLKPVVSNNREIGVEWRRGALSASAGHWWSDSELGSLLVRNADGIYDVVRRPIALRGLDVAIDWKTPLEGLTVGGAFARTRGRTDANGDGIDEDLDGANISPDRLNLHAEYESGPFDARLAARTYLERRFDSGAPGQRDPFEGYTLIDAAIGYRIGNKRVSLGIHNLTDAYYVTYYSDTLGRRDADSYFAGRGRTVTLGVSADF